jgi:alanyl-tRNA synthetase
VPSRIYYTDPYCLEFDATVTEVVPAGDRWRVRLNQTAFYPTTGGQPFDIGTLASGSASGDSTGAAKASTVKVVDVNDEEGEVDHLTDAPLEVGATVHGTIDRARRLDHMQQHTGQHILSAAFDRFAKVRTESFHLGSVTSTIDLGREVTPMEIARAEDEANRVVWEDRPVSIRFVTAEEAATLPLRKEPQRGGDLRLIDIQDFDLSACGGTHVARTGEIGLIAVRGWERFKGGTRVEFVCGARALRSFRDLRDIVNSSIRLLSVLPSELPGAIERAQAESKDARRQLKDATQKLAVHEAATLAASAEPLVTSGSAAGGATAGTASGEGATTAKAVIRAVDGYDAAGLKTLAATIVAQPGFLAALVSTTSPALVAIARSSDVAIDSAAVLKGLMSRFGGKGGGRPDFAQGGGLTASSTEIVAAIRELLA